MTSSTIRLVVASAAVVTAVQLLAVREAHTHEAHHKPAESETPAQVSEEMSPKALSEEANSSPDPLPFPQAVDTDTVTTTTQEIPTVQPTASEAGLLHGFSVGLGESLLALIVTGPFFLMSFKKRSQRQSKRTSQR